MKTWLACALIGFGWCAQHSAAAQDASETQSLEAQLKAKPDNLKVREALAQNYFKQKQWNKVVETLNPYTDEASISSLLSLATAYFEQKNPVDQVRVLKLVRIKDPDNYNPHFLLAHALGAQATSEKDPLKRRALEEEAIASYRQVQRLKPDYKPVYDALLAIFLRDNNRHEARELINEMIRKFGRRPEFYNELCRLYSTDSFIEPAIEHCQTAITISPSYPDNYVYLALGYRDQQEMEKAGKTLSSAAKRFSNSEFIQRAAGQFFTSSKNFPVAARYFQQGVTADPKSSISQLGLAMSLFEMKEYDKALEHYQKACELDRTLADKILDAGGKLRQSDSIRANKYSAAGYVCKNKR